MGIAIIYGDQYDLRLYNFGTDMPIASSDTDALKDLKSFGG